MWPVPASHPITTPYGKRGHSWSCNENSSGGVHTGADLACPSGTALYAAIDGQIRHRNYGSAFGNHQFAISPDPGQPWADGEVFYAHARKRLADGTYVQAGDWVGEAGAEGNVTGPHLHIELHPTSKNVWNCSIHANPQPALDWQPSGGSGMGYDYDYLGKPGGTQTIGTGYEDLDDSHYDPAHTGWENTYVYLNIRPTRWKSGATIGAVRLRIIRADGDATAHHDFVVAQAALDEDGATLRHMLYWEAGDGGKTRVQVKCEGGLTECVLGTRYTKKAIVLD